MVHYRPKSPTSAYKTYLYLQAKIGHKVNQTRAAKPTASTLLVVQVVDDEYARHGLARVRRLARFEDSGKLDVAVELHKIVAPRVGESKRSGVGKKIHSIGYSGGGSYTCRAEGGRTALFNGCDAFGLIVGMTLHQTTPLLVSRVSNSEADDREYDARVTDMVFGLVYLGCRVAEVDVHVVLDSTCQD
ncbi:hypothetical protein BHM03_00058779 [Ensete ventricosum]|uniref:Uncharacterized protein n=1 Tax=Ensete ventricosum TaxID=4639 RepID=A0A445MML8_ENSVE|nr:hypothetical protein BHM03_00058779 [Ensete ventricosum]